MFGELPMNPLGNPIGDGLNNIANMIAKARERQQKENEFRAKLFMDQQNINADNARADREMTLQERSFERTNQNQKEERHRKAVDDFKTIWEAAGHDPQMAVQLAKAHGFTLDMSNPSEPKAMPGRLDRPAPAVSGQPADNSPAAAPAAQQATSPIDATGPNSADIHYGESSPGVFVDQVDNGSAHLVNQEGGGADVFNFPVNQLPPDIQARATEGAVIPDPRAAQSRRDMLDIHTGEGDERMPVSDAELGQRTPGSLPTGDEVAAALANVGRKKPEGKKRPKLRFNLGDVGSIDVGGPAPDGLPKGEDVAAALAKVGQPSSSMQMMPARDVQPAAYSATEPPPLDAQAPQQPASPPSVAQRLTAALGGGVSGRVAGNSPVQQAAFRIRGGPGELPELTIDPEASRAAGESALADQIRLKSAGPEATAFAALLRERQREDAQAERDRLYRSTEEERRRRQEIADREAMARTRVMAGSRVDAARINATGQAQPASDGLPEFGTKAGNAILEGEGKLDNIVQRVLTNTGYKAEALQDRKFNQLTTIIAGARDNAALAQAGAGAWVKQAQGGVGVLSDKDMNVFWDRIGGIPERVENYIDTALSGKMGAERQRTVGEAVKVLGQTARNGMERIGQQVATRLGGTAYATPEVIDRYLETYIPGYHGTAGAPDAMHTGGGPQRPARQAAPRSAPAAHPSGDPVGTVKTLANGQRVKKVGPNNWQPVQ